MVMTKILYMFSRENLGVRHWTESVNGVAFALVNQSLVWDICAETRQSVNWECHDVLYQPAERTGPQRVRAPGVRP